MEEFDFIKKQLEAFIRKYYLNELLKGTILFFSIWLLYFLTILIIEYLLWLPPAGRSILFWLFIAVSLGLLARFIFYPLLKLFRLSRGIDHMEASRIIGNHFPEVNDKLLNVLQLQRSSQQSDLLLASIAQKSRELKFVPFRTAVNYRSSLRYLKYAVLPVLIVVMVFFTGNQAVFSESYNRVIDYRTAYEPPAPFAFVLGNEHFKVEEGKNLPLQVHTQGNIIPETVSIHFNDEIYFLKNTGTGAFQFQFQNVKEDLVFHLEANGVRSRNYSVEVVEVPRLMEFEMALKFPEYLNKASEKIKGTGNIIVPEGTNITWNLNTRSTDEVSFTLKDTIFQFKKEQNDFHFSNTVLENTNYTIKTSNANVKEFEALAYKIEVIKDEYPDIRVEHQRDSIAGDEIYFFGKATDDHSITKLNLVYYKNGDEEATVKTVSIPVNKEVFTEFYYTFPGSLNLDRGEDYNMYFEVFDNDGLRGPKGKKSEIFNYRLKTSREVEEEKLQKQGESIQNLSQSLDRMQMSEKELEELSRLQKEKEQLNFNERKKLDNFLERQKQQTQMMKNYSEKLKESLKEENGKSTDPFKKELDERLERNEERLKENEKLLEELQKYSDRISREELSEKLEKLSKQNNNEQKSLQQLLELTKRYYVQEKTQKLAREILDLGEKQEELAGDDTSNTKEEQEKLNKEFQKFQEQMEELQKENEGLKKPMDMERDEQEESQIKKDQENATEKLEENDKKGASEKQKNAGEKMKEMGAKMKKTQMTSQGEQLNASIESLRQILSNLMIFSFEQEELLLQFRRNRPNDPNYARDLKKQQVLKEHFQHVDDSLFALAMNNPMISEKITSKLTDIEFDINKSLERLAQNELPQGTASQQYVMTGTNELALMLSDVLGNMQEMANPSMSPGSGGEENQLMDIIMTQEELQKQMEEGVNEQEGNGKDSDGEGQEEGEEEGKGNEGESSQQLKEEMSGRLFEIFKQQQLLKQQLENQLKENGLLGEQEQLLRQMEEVEKEILEKGFNRSTLEKMNRISHKLMELENATLEQEEDERRSARTNMEEYNNRAEDQNLRAKEYFQSIEILNRQNLPLRQIYKAKVKQYFEGIEN